MGTKLALDYRDLSTINPRIKGVKVGLIEIPVILFHLYYEYWKVMEGEMGLRFSENNNDKY